MFLFEADRYLDNLRETQASAVIMHLINETLLRIWIVFLSRKHRIKTSRVQYSFYILMKCHHRI